MQLSTSSSLWENLEVGAFFFVIDLLVIVLILPFVLRLAEGRRWRPMREEIIKSLVQCQRRAAEALQHDFEAIFALYLSQHISDRTGDQVSGTEGARIELAAAHSELHQTIDLMAPAIEPAMARAIIDLIHLPNTLTADLCEIDSYLNQLLYFHEELGPEIEVSSSFRGAVHNDIFQISNQIGCASQELEEVVSRSSIPRPERKAFKAGLLKDRDDHLEMLAAAHGLMELLIHRTKYYFDNVRYENTEKWLCAHELPYRQIQALLRFGDKDVVNSFWNAPARVRRHLDMSGPGSASSEPVDR